MLWLMGNPRTILGAGLLVVLAACGGHESDNVTIVAASGSRSGGSAAGGGVIQVSGSPLVAEGPAWVFDEPTSFEGPVPPVSLIAIGDALFRAGADSDVVDAVKTARGTVALVRAPDGKLFLGHFGGETPALSPAPRGARRVLRGTRSPLTVKVLVADDLAVRATRTAE
jgi:hypothetical protein